MGIVISGNKNLKFIKSVYYQPPQPPEYLTIEALEDGFYIAYIDVFYEMGYTDEDIQMVCNETGWEYEKMQYSLDKTNWYILEPYEPTPYINAGEKIYLKRRFITPGLYNEIYSPLTHIFCEYQYNLSGNCNSILFGDSKGELFDHCFFQLFMNSYVINVSPNFLPATSLDEECYSGMFYECTSLVSAPELPATTSASGCYGEMFEGCTSLVNAPSILPATALAESCYYRMFMGCSSLVSAPALPATALAYGCYIGMFRECTSLVTAPELPATTLADDCYDSMFMGCTSLVTAPALPATALANWCYYYMFSGCSSLVSAPALPATTLVTQCYYYMFSGCSSLNYIKALFTTTPKTSYTENWVSGVSSTGTFVKSKDATWDVTGSNGIPTGWTVQTV